MSANSHLKYCYCTKQAAGDKGLVFDLVNGSGAYQLRSSGVTTTGMPNNLTSLEHILLPYSGDPDKWVPNTEDELRLIFEDLARVIGVILREDRFVERMLITTSVLGSHFHQLFLSMPIQWLHVPAYGDVLRITEILRELCFNAHAVKGRSSFEMVATLADQLTSTLLFMTGDGFDKEIVGRILECENSRHNIILGSDLSVRRLYSPRIVVSTEYPPYSLSKHIFTLNVNSLSDTIINVDYAAMRTCLLKWVVSMGPQLEGIINSLSTQRKEQTNRNQERATQTAGVIHTKNAEPNQQQPSSDNLNI